MNLFDRIQALLNRVSSYSRVEVLIELVVIWLVVLAVVKFVQGTRAAGALKGLLFILVFATIIARVLGQGQSFQRITFLYDRFLTVVTVALVVIFQPELRLALVRLGASSLFRTHTQGVNLAVDALAEACRYLSRAKFGALIALEREVGLRGMVEGGTPIGAELTATLIQTIFFPGTALHDLGVVIKGNVVQAAGVQFPLAEPADMPDTRLGSRHRAAVGLSKESDAIVITVSEETGQIRLAEGGRLSQALSSEELQAELLRRLKGAPPPPNRTAAEEQAMQPPPSDEPPARGAGAPVT
ncbi:MAG: diadenylate cyclase [Phycisphaerales bacterium]|nr:diadenylate cyclase [Phycisphaerales bacterium]